jgi:hypothetical protein
MPQKCDDEFLQSEDVPIKKRTLELKSQSLVGTGILFRLLALHTTIFAQNLEVPVFYFHFRILPRKAVLYCRF